jgi:glycosyltransferase involved in cell wall biosynthesis
MYGDQIDAGTAPPARPRGYHGETSRPLVRIAKNVLEGLALPYVRPVAGRDAVLLSSQSLLLTSAPWVVDIEHPTPFVGTNYLRFDQAPTLAIIRALLERPNCVGVIAWSEACRRAFVQKVGRPAIEAKTRVLRPTTAVTRSGAKPRVGLSRMCFAFGYPEHNYYIKSGKEVIEAFFLAKRSIPDLELHVIGPLPESVRTKLGATPGLVIHGFVDRDTLTSILARCDLLILPTVTDTFGMLFLEGFAAGLPALAIDWFATSEIVRPGVNGVLIEKPDGLVSWLGKDGCPTMNCGDFIRARTDGPADQQTAIALAEQLLSLHRDPSRLRSLSEGALETMATGPYSRDAFRHNAEAIIRSVRDRVR